MRCSSFVAVAPRDVASARQVGIFLCLFAVKLSGDAVCPRLLGSFGCLVTLAPLGVFHFLQSPSAPAPQRGLLLLSVMWMVYRLPLSTRRMVSATPPYWVCIFASALTSCIVLRAVSRPRLAPLRFLFLLCKQIVARISLCLTSPLFARLPVCRWGGSSPQARSSQETAPGDRGVGNRRGSRDLFAGCVFCSLRLLRLSFPALPFFFFFSLGVCVS
jgi:hypothetical protein